MPTSRSRGGTSFTRLLADAQSRPRRPAPSPAMIRKSVVLPQPDGPTITRNSPLWHVEVHALDDGVVAEALPDRRSDAGHGRTLTRPALSAGNRGQWRRPPLLARRSSPAGASPHASIHPRRRSPSRCGVSSVEHRQALRHRAQGAVARRRGHREPRPPRADPRRQGRQLLRLLGARRAHRAAALRRPRVQPADPAVPADALRRRVEPLRRGRRRRAALRLHRLGPELDLRPRR